MKLSPTTTCSPAPFFIGTWVHPLTKSWNRVSQAITGARSAKLLAVGLGLSVAGISRSAQAANQTWTGSTDALWTSATNWSGGAIPTATDLAIFDVPSTANLATTLNADFSIRGLTIANPSGPVSIGAGNTLTLGSGGIDMSAATQDLTISSGLTLLGTTGQIWNVAAGRILTLDTGTFTRSAGATLNIQGTGTVATTSITNVNGILGGWASVGSGTSLSYATKNVSNQIVALTGSGIFSNTSNSATTNFDMTGNVSISAGSGSRSVNTVRSTGGALTITLNTNRHIQVTSGIMNAGTGSLTIATSGTGIINPLGTDLTFVTNTQAFNINAPIGNQNFGSNPVTVTFASPDGGTFTLSGVNTFTGGTTINSGILALGNATNTLADTGPVNVTGGTLSLTNRNDTVGVVTLTAGNITSTTGVLTGSSYALQSGAVSAILGGSGSVTKSTAGTVTLTGANTYTGTTTINGGVLQIGAGASGSLGGGNYAGAINNTGTLAFNSTVNQSLTGGVTGGGTLTKAASGTLTLSNTNVLGTVNLTGGILNVSGFTTADTANIGDGTTLGAKVTNAANGVLTLGGLTFGSSGGSNLAVDFNLLASPSVPLINMSAGTLTLQGNVALTLANTSNLSSGIITLIDYLTLAPNGFFFTQTSTALTPRTTATVSNDPANTRIILTIAADRPKWTGLDGPNWVVGTTGASGNWKLVNANTATDYIEGDDVLFNDTATLNRTIDISAANVSPGSTTFTTDALNYKLTSSGGFGISGTGPLTKNGSGTVTLTTTNIYTGSTTINAGTLQLGDGTTDGTIANTSGVTNNGTLAFNWASNHTAGYPISGTGAVTKTGAGALTLSGVNTYTGGTNLNAGTLTAGSTTALGGPAGILTINGGSLDSAVANLVLANNNAQNWNGDFTFAGTNSLNLGTGAVAMSASRQVTVSANTLTVGGVVSGTGFSLTKAGAGTLFLAGANTYDGGTIINGGTLTFNQGNAISGSIDINNGATLKGQNTTANTGTPLTAFGTAPINLNNGGLLQLSENMSGFNRIFTVANAVTVSGAARVDAIATANTGQNYQFNSLTLGDASVLTISDTTNKFGGFGAANTLLKGNATITDQTGTGTGGGQMRLSAVTVDNSATAGTTSTLTVNGTNPFAAIIGVLSDNATDATKKLALLKDGVGTVAISGLNTYTGGTNLNQGVVVLGTNGTLGGPTSALAVNNTNSTAAGTAAVLSLATAADTISGSLSGSIATPTSGTNTATINTAASRNFTVNQTVAGNYAGVIAGAGSFTLGSLSTSTLTLSGANTYTGTTKVNAGTLALGNVNAIQGSPLDVTGTGAVAFAVAGTNTYLFGGLRNNAGTGAVGTTLAAGTNSITFGSSAISSVTISNGSDFNLAAAIAVTTGGSFTLDGIFNITIGTTFQDSSKAFNLFDGNTGGAFSSVNLSGNYTATLNAGNNYAFTNGDGSSFAFDNSSGVLNFQLVPEPSSLLLEITGLVGFLSTIRRRKSSVKHEA